MKSKKKKPTFCVVHNPDALERFNERIISVMYQGFADGLTLMEIQGGLDYIMDAQCKAIRLTAGAFRAEPSKTK